MAKFYVLNVGGARSWVLDLDPCNRTEADRKISWQVKGGADRNDFRVCTYDRATNTFPDADAPVNRYQPDNGPYTQEAWQAFCERLKYDPDGEAKEPKEKVRA